MSAPLFDPPPLKLTERQAAAFAYLQGDGKTALQVGVMLHLARERPCPWCKLSGGSGCDFAELAGKEVLGALRNKGLVIRKRSTGLWMHVGAKTPANPIPNAQGDFPADFQPA